MSIIDTLKLTWKHVVIDRVEKEIQELSQERDKLKERALLLKVKYDLLIKDIEGT